MKLRVLLFLLIVPFSVFALDFDGDGIPDESDNCLNLSNADQTDTNGDGIGNRCDADLNNDGKVDAADYNLFVAAVKSQNPDADFNADGKVDRVDYQYFRQLASRGAPGPAAPSAFDLNQDGILDVLDYWQIWNKLDLNSRGTFFAEYRYMPGDLDGQCVAYNGGTICEDFNDLLIEQCALINLAGLQFNTNPACTQ